MKKCIKPFALVFLAVSLSCVPSARKSGGGVTAVPSTNEKIWLAPLIDNSGITRLDEWPKDSLQADILLRHFDEIRSKLLSEFRRCEKYGHYQTVDDSLRSTIRVFTSLERRRMHNDTLQLSVSLLVTSPLENQRWTFVHEFFATAPGNRKVSDPFHYSGLLLVDLSSSFPYRQIVYPFYKSTE
jgi:hypothetical protein